jgi:hypothetical protein
VQLSNLTSPSPSADSVGPTLSSFFLFISFFFFPVVCLAEKCQVAGTAETTVDEVLPPRLQIWPRTAQGGFSVVDEALAVVARMLV